jgi:hypothetical protein
LILDALKSGDMPPEKEKLPDPKILHEVIQSLEKVLAETTELPFESHGIPIHGAGFTRD